MLFVYIWSEPEQLPPYDLVIRDDSIVNVQNQHENKLTVHYQKTKRLYIKLPMISRLSHMNRDSSLKNAYSNAYKLNFIFKLALYFSVLLIKLLTVVESYFTPKLLL